MDPLLWHFPQGISGVRFVMFLEDLNIKNNNFLESLLTF